MAWLLFAAAGIAVLSGCRQDMQNQPKFIPLRSSEFFSDRRSARYPVPGTVPRLCRIEDKDTCPLEEQTADQAQLDPNSYYLTGKHGNVYGNELPLSSDSPEKRAQVLARGQDRYNIYCTPCHSLVGDGNGMIVQRGYKRPPSFHVQRLRNAPLGYFYDVISNGFGGMPDYGSQVKPADRWAITAYIRALQLSQHAEEADVLPANRNALTAPEENGIRTPDTSIQPPRPAPQPEGGVKR